MAGNKGDFLREVHKEGLSRGVMAIRGLIGLYREEAMKALKTADDGNFRRFQGQVQVLEKIEEDIAGKPAPAPSGSGAYGG